MKKIILLGIGAVVTILVAAVGAFMVLGPDVGSPVASGPVSGGNGTAVAIDPPAGGATEVIAVAPADAGPAENTVPAENTAEDIATETASAPATPTVPTPATSSASAPQPGDQEVPRGWQAEFPQTDFSLYSLDFSEIFSGGPPRDGIPSIDDPSFGTVAEAAEVISATEPMITLELNGEAKAYPLTVLMYHEIVNDEIGGRPVAVTFCPLCNSTIVFAAEIDGQILDFGTTGRLRNSDLVMYDRQTESWWQQFTGEGLIGAHTGRRLDILPARVEAFSKFQTRHPDGMVMKTPEAGLRRYGTNPYSKYDQAGVPADEQRRPFLFFGEQPENIGPLAYVVAVGDRAWALDMVRDQGRMETDDGLVIEWTPGQNSALDASRIADGQDIGNITVQRSQDGAMVDIAYDVSFAFAFNAFHPEGQIIK